MYLCPCDDTGFTGPIKSTFTTWNGNSVRDTGVRNYRLHLATGRTRDDIEKRIWQRERRKARNGRERG
ncbi:hypothetical protein TNCV_3648981 [Trichonephila clavipes]|nr:hypothetical protein TNCV_3648981 [Trichonephila clavipes]